MSNIGILILQLCISQEEATEKKVCFSAAKTRNKIYVVVTKLLTFAPSLQQQKYN